MGFYNLDETCTWTNGEVHPRQVFMLIRSHTPHPTQPKISAMHKGIVKQEVLEQPRLSEG